MVFFDYVSEQTEKVTLLYRDDSYAVDEPERFRGQLPNVGYKIHSLPDSGFFGFSVGIHLSNGFGGNPDLFSGKLRRLPDLVVTKNRNLQ